MADFDEVETAEPTNPVSTLPAIAEVRETDAEQTDFFDTDDLADFLGMVESAPIIKKFKCVEPETSKSESFADFTAVKPAQKEMKPAISFNKNRYEDDSIMSTLSLIQEKNKKHSKNKLKKLAKTLNAEFSGTEESELFFKNCLGAKQEEPSFVTNNNSMWGNESSAVSISGQFFRGKKEPTTPIPQSKVYQAGIIKPVQGSKRQSS